MKHETSILVRSLAAERLDVLPLLVVTAVRSPRSGYDRRRFRPNLVSGGVTGYPERDWEGRRLAVGDATRAGGRSARALHHDDLRGYSHHFRIRTALSIFGNMVT